MPRPWASAAAAACGAVLAEDVVAGVSVPPEDNSAVDGYAVHHADLASDQPTLLPVLAPVGAPTMRSVYASPLTLCERRTEAP